MDPRSGRTLRQLLRLLLVELALVSIGLLALLTLAEVLDGDLRLSIPFARLPVAGAGPRGA